MLAGLFDSQINQRPIIPKSDPLSSAVQQLTGRAPPPPQTQQQPGNLLVPQGIQHVLINGALYPIIQTTNGTHLLIQQPVGQVQQGGKQVFTAQPIQLGSMQQLAVGGTPVSTAQHMSYAAPGAQLQAHTPLQPTTQNSQSNLSQPIQATDNATQAGAVNATAPALLLPTTEATSTASSSSSANQSVTNPSQMSKAGSGSGLSSIHKNLVAVDARTQQLLTRIQGQIDAFKSKPSLDAGAKNTLLQLQEAQQRVINNVRAQTQKPAHAPSASQQNRSCVGNGGTIMAPMPQAPPFLHPTPQLLQQEVPQASSEPKKLVIKPGEFA